MAHFCHVLFWVVHTWQCQSISDILQMKSCRIQVFSCFLLLLLLRSIGKLLCLCHFFALGFFLSSSVSSFLSGSTHEVLFMNRFCFLNFGLSRGFLLLHFSRLQLPERIYNPIMAMGFSAMLTFQLDNTKR
jgi:hypothetical protein